MGTVNRPMIPIYRKEMPLTDGDLVKSGFSISPPDYQQYQSDHCAIYGQGLRSRPKQTKKANPSNKIQKKTDVSPNRI
jgi:hypothetical protein